MGINIKGILLSLMAMVLVSGMMGAAYARSDSPVRTYCDSGHGSCDENDCDSEHDGYGDNDHDYGDDDDGCGDDDHDSSLNLQIRDQNESWRDGVSATWLANNMSPGTEYPFEGAFDGLRSNVKGGITISCDYKVREEIPANEVDREHNTNLFPDKMARQLIITRALYKSSSWQIDLLTGEPSGMSTKDRRSYTNGRSFLWKIPDVDRDGRITFYDIKHKPLTNLPLPASTGEGARYQMGVRFAATAGNDLQGDIFNLTMLYTLSQW